LWFSLVDTPESCIPVLRALVQEARVSPDEIWSRVRRLMEAKRVTGARAVAARLTAEQLIGPSVLDKSSTNPSTYLDPLPAHFSARRQRRAMVLIHLTRPARDAPQGACIR